MKNNSDDPQVGFSKDNLKRAFDGRGARFGLALAVALGGSGLDAAPAFAQGNVSWSFSNTGIDSYTAAWSQTNNGHDFVDVYGYGGTNGPAANYTVELKRQNWIYPDLGMGSATLPNGGGVGRIPGDMIDDWYYLRLAAVDNNYSSTKTVSAAGRVQWCNPGC